jgi:arylformamidase
VVVRIFDVSFPIRDQMPGFPGDPEVRVTRVKSLTAGDPYNVSSLSLSSHTGTHVDPPIHFVPGGATIDQIDPARLNGPCHVVVVPEGRDSIGPAEVDRTPPGTERVVFRTRNSDRWRAAPDEFFADYVAVTPEGAQRALDRGIRLVGVDSLSVERDASGTFPVHHLLLGAGALIIEGLLLGEVSPGAYELRCLPLCIAGGDGGPSRALLVAP